MYHLPVPFRLLIPCLSHSFVRAQSPPGVPLLGAQPLKIPRLLSAPHQISISLIGTSSAYQGPTQALSTLGCYIPQPGWPGLMIPFTSRTSTLKPSIHPLPSVETPSIQAYTHPPLSLKPNPKPIMLIDIYLGQSSDTRTSSSTMPDSPCSKDARYADRCDSESWLRKQHERNRLRIWMISLCFFVAIGILIAIFAWLGSNNWFKHGNE